jgi:hypothetical protein
MVVLICMLLLFAVYMQAANIPECNLCDADGLMLYRNAPTQGVQLDCTGMKSSGSGIVLYVSGIGSNVPLAQLFDLGVTFVCAGVQVLHMQSH